MLSREREAQRQQLVLSADIADLDWHEAEQSLMIATVRQIKQADFEAATGLAASAVFLACSHSKSG